LHRRPRLSLTPPLLLLSLTRRAPRPPLFPYPTLFRSGGEGGPGAPRPTTRARALLPPLTPPRRHKGLRGRRTASAAAPQAFVPSHRKSTRLNSSHLPISYAAFCLHNKTTKSTSGSPQP